MTTASPTVYVVHCVDTEGPLDESMEATFKRLETLFNIKLSPTRENLCKIQSASIPLGGIEKTVARTFAPHLLAYNSNWQTLDHMLLEIMNPTFRDSYPDSFGQGWIFNWHCVDHVGYVENPRKREFGFHAIFDHYLDMIKCTGSNRDKIFFHHHPIPFDRNASHSGTHYFSHMSMIFEILARRIIDRHWFPSVYRPGFHVERPDSHWFLEQFIPFDYASQASSRSDNEQMDQAGGRFGDWRRAPLTWSPYHPHHDDYQSEGSCRRWITRCLNVGTRHHLLIQNDVDDAFAQAASGQPTILAFSNHDHRDMRPDVVGTHKMLIDAAARHRGVLFRYCDGREAMRSALKMPDRPPISFDVVLKGGTLNIRASAPTFGPQPFLAIKTRDGRYLHDNFDFEESFRSWNYVFDEMTVPLNDVDTIGIASCDPTGNVTVATVDPKYGRSNVVTY